MSVAEDEKLIAQTFANIVRGRREQLGLTQPGLAERSEVSTTTIYNYENGISFPKGWAGLIKLAKALNLKPWQLLFDGTTELESAFLVVGNARFSLVRQS